MDTSGRACSYFCLHNPLAAFKYRLDLHFTHHHLSQLIYNKNGKHFPTNAPNLIMSANLRLPL